MQEKEIYATDRKKLIVLVIYDITDSKKRLKGAFFYFNVPLMAGFVESIPV